jgi:hypothetical protein
VATITYLGKGNKNGHGDELDREKIEGLRLQNAISRAKLQRLDGDVVAKREVAFILGHMLLLLRTQILTVPALVSSELRGVLDNVQLHNVRQRAEDAVHRFLTQLAENMEAAMHGEEFLAKLEASLSGKKDDDAARLKHDIAKAERTRKRHEKAGKNEG